MNKTLKPLAVTLSLVGLVGTLFAGCNISKPTVSLNDYVEITEDGYDGYGTVYASLDYNQIIADYADYLTDKSLDTQYFGNQTAEMAASFVFASYDPYELAYHSPDDLVNGDTVNFSWNTSESAIDTLAQILKEKSYRGESICSSTTIYIICSLRTRNSI